MNTAHYWDKKTCIDCKRVKCKKGCLCDCHLFRDRPY